MPIDAAVQNLLEGLNAQGVRSFEHMSVAEARATVASFVDLQTPPEPVAQVIDTTYPGPAGDQSIRLYIPDAPGPLPVVAYYHGGGFVTGDLTVTEELCRSLANDAGAIVAAVTYRLAPEHKFPAATDDTYAALCWIAENATGFGGDPTRIAVHGDSAGGNLAAVAALRARDESGPALTCQVLTYPVIDPAPIPRRAPNSVRATSSPPPDSTGSGTTTCEPPRTPKIPTPHRRRHPHSPGCPRPHPDHGIRGRPRRGRGLRQATRQRRCPNRHHPLRRACARRVLISGAIPAATEIRSAVAEYLRRQFGRHPLSDLSATR